MTAERHMVTIETEKTGAIMMMPEQFDLLLQCAQVGLDGLCDIKPSQKSDADALWNMVTRAAANHAA